MRLERFDDTLAGLLKGSKAFRRSFLSETLFAMTSGDLPAGKLALRHFVNNTIGFPALGVALDRSPKSLMRMLGPTGNPQASNLFQILLVLQRNEGMQFAIRPVLVKPQTELAA
jgi:hypothetical protein